MIRLSCYPIAGVLFFLSANVAADGMRCGNRLISTGDKKAEVLIKCGEPLTKETITVNENTEYAQLVLQYPSLHKHGLLKKNNEAIVGRETSISYSIDQWIYNPGSGKFLKILYFRAGELVVIEDGDRM